MRPTVACAALLALALGAALLVGRVALSALVLIVCALLLVDVQGLLRRAGTPAILPASAVAGLGAPLVIVTEADVTLTAVVAAAFLLAVLIGLVARRRRITKVLGASLVAGLLPGLGGSAVVLLWDADPALLVALVGALVGGEAAAAGVSRWRGRALETTALAALVGTAAAAAVAAVTLPLQLATGLGALALLGVLGGAGLRGALLRSERPLPGLVVAATASLALSAPAALAMVGGLPIQG